MAGQLQLEIRRRDPFGQLEEEVFLNLLRTADALVRGIAEVLRGEGVSPPQYNVLRILRGAGEAGLRCGEVAERMVTHDPDVTRLLDRMEVLALIRRERDRPDRRVVTTRITARGLEVLARLERPVSAAHGRQLGLLGDRRLRLLVDLLEAARTPRADGGGQCATLAGRHHEPVRHHRPLRSKAKLVPRPAAPAPQSSPGPQRKGR